MEAVVIAVIGATLSAVLGGIGSSLGIVIAGVKGSAVLGEQPDLFGKILVMVALPGSQGVYGLLIAVLAISKAGLFGPLDVPLTMEAGQKILFAGLIMGVSGLFSGWAQGKIVASGISSIARNESISGKAVVLSVIVETYAIFGLL